MSLLGKTIAGMAWTLGGSLGSRTIALVGTLVLTHFIDPDIDGQVGIAAVLMLTAGQLSNFAFGQFIASRPNASRELVFHATVYHMVSGLVAAGLLLALRDVFALMYDAPGVAEFTVGFAITLVLDRVGYVPERILVRDMRFRAISLTRSITEVAFSTAAVLLAMAGWGGESIVIANILRSGARSAIFMAIVDRRDWLTPCRLAAEHRRELLSFGMPLWLANVTHFASRSWDNLVFAALFGPGPSALYAKAYNLADVPATHIGESIGDVLVPSFARMRKEERGGELVRWTALLGLIVFPLAIGLGAVAPPLVRVLFNERWQGMAPLLTALSVLSVVRPISWTVASYLQAQNRPRTLMVLEVGKTVLLFVGMALLGRLGPVWACIGVGLAFTAATAGSLWAVKVHDGVSPGAFLRALWRPLAACAPMVVAVLAVSKGARALGVSNVALELVAALVVGAAVYVASALLIAGTVARDAVWLVKDAMSERRRPPPSVVSSG